MFHPRLLTFINFFLVMNIMVMEILCSDGLSSTIRIHSHTKEVRPTPSYSWNKWKPGRHIFSEKKSITSISTTVLVSESSETQNTQNRKETKEINLRIRTTQVRSVKGGSFSPTTQQFATPLGFMQKHKLFPREVKKESPKFSIHLVNIFSSMTEKMLTDRTPELNPTETGTSITRCTPYNVGPKSTVVTKISSTSVPRVANCTFRTRTPELSRTDLKSVSLAKDFQTTDFTRSTGSQFSTKVIGDTSQTQAKPVLEDISLSSYFSTSTINTYSNFPIDVTSKPLHTRSSKTVGSDSTVKSNFTKTVQGMDASNSSLNTTEHTYSWSILLLTVDYSLGFYSIATFIGCMGNIYVLVDAFKALRKLHTNEIFLIQLCVINIFTLLTTTVMVIFMKIRWEYTCHAIFSLTTAYAYGNVYTLTTISYQQYYAIAFPFRPKTSVPKLVAIILTIVFTSVVFSLPVAVYPNLLPRPCVPGSLTELPLRRLYYLATTVLQYVLPLSVIAVYYVKLAILLKKSRLELERHSDGPQVQSPRKKRDRRVAMVMITMVISFAVCLLPQHVQFILIEFVFNKLFTYGLAVFTYFPILLKACIDPVIYGAVGRKLKSRCCHRNTEVSSNQTHSQPRNEIEIITT